jgi:hypothetical protein
MKERNEQVMIQTTGLITKQTIHHNQYETKQNKTKQNKTKQNKTKQNKTKQNKTKQTKQNCTTKRNNTVPTFTNSRTIAVTVSDGTPNCCNSTEKMSSSTSYLAAL